MSDREKLLNLTREATARIANHCANTSCEKCAKDSGKYDKESGKCKCSTMEMFTDHLIANGVTVQKWIPVSERLPKYREDVLVTDGKSVCTAWLSKSNAWIRSYTSAILDGFTHWMPMPYLPMEEEK